MNNLIKILEELNISDLDYIINPEDKIRIEKIQALKIPIEDKILKILNLQVFRSAKLPVENNITTAKKIKEALEEKKPITFLIPFGAYKNYKSYSYPHINFSELLNVLYINYLLTTIEKIYPYKVLAIYIPDLAYCVSKIVHSSDADINIYHEEMEKLIKSIDNNNIIFLNNKELLDKMDINISELDKLIEEKIIKNNSIIEDQHVLALINKIDVSKIKENELSKTISSVKKSFIYHQYYVDIIDSYIAKIFPFAIPMTSKKSHPSSGFIFIKSFFNSIVQFWVGDGAIISSGEKNYFTILSNSQRHNYNFNGFLEIKNKKLSQINNYFKHIPIYENK